MEPELNENFIFETRKNSAVILIMVKAFWAVMYQILAVNDRWPPVISSANIVFFFNPALTNNIDKFVEFPKDIHVARQKKFLGHAFFPIL